MSRDELAVMDGGKCILQLRGVRPFLSDKYDLSRHPTLQFIESYWTIGQQIHDIRWKRVSDCGFPVSSAEQADRRTIAESRMLAQLLEQWGVNAINCL